MKLLLTSAGIKNKSIEDALVALLGKPIGEASALCVPTALYPMGGPHVAWRFINGQLSTPLCELGWKSLGVLELTALPSLDEKYWFPLVQETDALLVAGGDSLYLSHWLRLSGMAALIPTLDAVYVGISGGSMALTPRVGSDFMEWAPPSGNDTAAGVVDFSIFPHLDHEKLPENSLADAERWAAEIQGPAYAIDDQTAIKVTDDGVEMISEGNWRRFPS